MQSSSQSPSIKKRNKASKAEAQKHSRTSAAEHEELVPAAALCRQKKMF